VHSYGKVTVKNIYPGIDWVLHTGKQGLKYDFVVHPGADPSLIKLKYKWTDTPQLQDDGSVKISTPMGNITEGIPVSYCADKQIQTTYSIENNEIHFNVRTYNSSQTLTIDPTLVWATYFGLGPGGEDITCLQDDGANVWVTCGTNSINFPTLNPGNGAYFVGTLTSPNGCIGISKFNLNGVLIWGTYYGGSKGDKGNSIYSDGTNVWVTGTTNSTNFPTFNPGGGAYYQATNTNIGGPDLFIMKFSTAGVRKWATYYGSFGYNTAESISSDGTDVWITGSTTLNGLPTFNPGGGAYYQSFYSGSTSAFILEFDTAGARRWATDYAGNKATVAYSISSDGAHVWVTGFTNSTSLTMKNPGGGAYYQPAIAGKTNLFILEFDTARVLKWATYYGGDSTEFGNCIYSDGKNVWLTGNTFSPNFPVLNPGGGAYFQGTLSTPRGSAFILKFNTSGVGKWATYYGGSGHATFGDVGYWIQSAGSNVWFTGSTASSNFPVLNTGCGFNQDSPGDPYNDHPNPAQDIFISQFDTSGVPKWATFYGTDLEQDGNAIACDKTNLFVDGDGEFLEYPTVNPGGGAYYRDSADVGIYSGEFGFIGKFIIADSGNKLTVSPTVSICRGDTTTIRASGATTYNWSPPAGLSATNIPNPIASPTVTTTYTVAGGCAGIDSVKVIVDTFKSKVTIPKDTSICIGSSIILSVSGGGNYQWSTGNTSSSISVKNDSATHTYTVSISNGACKKDTSIRVTVIPKPNGNVNGNLVICKGDSTTLAASGGTLYKWSTGATTSAITISPSSNTGYSVEIIQNGCADTLSESVTVKPSLVINICCDSTITAGQTVQLISSGGGSYQWSPPTGLSCTTCPDPIASPNQTTTYTLTITNDSGCIVQSFVTIDLGCGTVFVPDVFSPNETHNNIFYVRGECIVSMDLMVFDRWGNKVFESKNPANGWDGTYNGKAMNMATYMWSLKATLRDGSSIKKHGDVMLVR